MNIEDMDLEEFWADFIETLDESRHFSLREWVDYCSAHDHSESSFFNMFKIFRELGLIEDNQHVKDLPSMLLSGHRPSPVSSKAYIAKRIE